MATIEDRDTEEFPMTTMLPAARRSSRHSKNIDPDQRWQVTAARDILEHGCPGEDFPSFVTTYGYSHYQSGRPGPRSNVQTADPYRHYYKVTS
jgi:hypothetical protein